MQQSPAKRAATRGRMGRIQRLPPELRDYIHRRLREGAAQTAIIDETRAMLDTLGEQPLSAAGLNRYATRMAQVGRRIREAREVAEVWTEKFGERPTGDLANHVIEMLRTLAFEAGLHASEQLNEDGESIIDPTTITQLTLAVQRLEQAASQIHQRERQVRAEVAKQAEVEARKAGLSADTAAAIRAALTQTDD